MHCQLVKVSPPPLDDLLVGRHVTQNSITVHKQLYTKTDNRVCCN